MPEKPSFASDYKREDLELVRQTCLYVATKLGDLLDDLVVVGGLVPSLLIKDDSLAANEDVFLQVKDDPVHGLQSPGGTGFIINDGPGSVMVQNADDHDGLSDESTVKKDEQLLFEKEDDVEICIVHITADTLGASYRSRFARIRP